MRDAQFLIMSASVTHTLHIITHVAISMLTHIVVLFPERVKWSKFFLHFCVGWANNNQTVARRKILPTLKIDSAITFSLLKAINFVQNWLAAEKFNIKEKTNKNSLAAILLRCCCQRREERKKESNKVHCD
jgi:hypothetical protein